MNKPRCPLDIAVRPNGASLTTAIVNVDELEQLAERLRQTERAST